MSRTYRRNPLDDAYGCFEDYRRNTRSATHYSIINDAARAHDLAVDQDRWNRRRRDGKTCDYNRRAGGGRKIYNHLSAKLIRNETRRAIQRGMTEDDWDNLIFPTYWDGKKFIWSVW